MCHIIGCASIRYYSKGSSVRKKSGDKNLADFVSGNACVWWGVHSICVKYSCVDLRRVSESVGRVNQLTVIAELPWSRLSDSNWYVFRHRYLKPTRLPITPSREKFTRIEMIRVRGWSDLIKEGAWRTWNVQHVRHATQLRPNYIRSIIMTRVTNVTSSCIRYKIYYILYRINHVYVEFGNYTFLQFMSVRVLTNCLNLR